ncbi:MAG: fatty acid desaturase [Verrucomicrobiota bacterium]
MEHVVNENEPELAAALADSATKKQSGRKISRVTAPFARESRKKSWWVTLSSLVYLVLAVIGTFPFWGWPFRLVCSVLAGLLIVRVFVIYHDHQHRAILSKSKVADRLMSAVGILALAPSSVWKHSHDEHHAHNSKLHGNDFGSFPTMTAERYAASSWKEKVVYRISRHPLTILCGYLTSFLYAMCIEPLVSNPRRHYDAAISLLVHVVIIALTGLFFGVSGIFFSIFLPFALAASFGSYLFYAQHNFPGVSLKDEDGWTYEGAALESSSYMKMPKFLHWFTANIGYHHIHHLNARIPFYRLPEVYKAIPELRKAKTTSLSPLEIFRCFRLKVWCVERARLVGYRG